MELKHKDKCNCDLCTLTDKVASLEKIISSYEKALTFYSEESLYLFTNDTYVLPQMYRDKGFTARQTLQYKVL